jgi:hypothetical protein
MSYGLLMSYIIIIIIILIVFILVLFTLYSKRHFTLIFKTYRV